MNFPYRKKLAMYAPFFKKSGAYLKDYFVYGKITV